MANFIGCTAEGNGGAGFVTNNKNSTFENCIAKENKGGGFIDISGPQAKQDVGQFVSEIEKMLNQNSDFERYREDILKETFKVKEELKDPKPKTSVLKSSFERIAEIAKIASGAKAVIELVDKIPLLIEFIQTNPIFI